MYLEHYKEDVDAHIAVPARAVLQRSDEHFVLRLAVLLLDLMSEADTSGDQAAQAHVNYTAQRPDAPRRRWAPWSARGTLSSRASRQCACGRRPEPSRGTAPSGSLCGWQRWWQLSELPNGFNWTTLPLLSIPNESVGRFRHAANRHAHKSQRTSRAAPSTTTAPSRQ